MFPFAIGNIFAPWHLAPRLQRGPHVGKIKGLVVIYLVGLTHVGVKKIERLLLCLSDSRPSAFRKSRTSKHGNKQDQRIQAAYILFHLSLSVLFHLSLSILFRLSSVLFHLSCFLPIVPHPGPLRVFLPLGSVSRSCAAAPSSRPLALRVSSPGR